MKLYIYYETINTHNSDGTEHYLARAVRSVRLFPRAVKSPAVKRVTRPSARQRISSLAIFFALSRRRRMAESVYPMSLFISRKSTGTVRAGGERWEEGEEGRERERFVSSNMTMRHHAKMAHTLTYNREIYQ